MPTKAKGLDLLQTEIMQSPEIQLRGESSVLEVPCGFPPTTSVWFR